MIVLAVDTSGPVCGVAVSRDGAVVYEAAAVNKRTHSASLMPMIDEALTRSSLKVGDINLFAAVTGPGSFTGVRIGVSTVKGMAHGAGKPCAGVNALQALAAGIAQTDMLICPIQDARAGQVYGAAFTAGMPPTRMVEDMAAKLADYLNAVLKCAKTNQQLCFVGDGVATYRDTIQHALGERAVFPPKQLSYLRAASVALLAETEPPVDYLTLMPHYLRAPPGRTCPESKIMIIRRMTKTDIKAVHAIELSTFAVPWPEASFHHELDQNPAARYLVAVDEGNGAVIAYAGAWMIFEEAHITNIAVREDCRGQGIGRKLTEALIQYAANLGVKYITLEVRKSNLTAQGMYKKLGFEKLSVRKRYYPDNQEDAFLMVLQHMPEVQEEFCE